MTKLGKRSGRPAPARHPMRRTTSMKEFAPPDALAGLAEEEELEDEEAELQLPVHAEGEAAEDPYGWAVGGAGRADWLAAYRARAAPALRRNSADLSAAFLRACGLCNRRLGPGRDTFMYRGDTAFCSLECRQQHMTIEEWKEKCALAAPPPAPPADPVAPAPTSPAARSPRSEPPARQSLPAAGRPPHIHAHLRAIPSSSTRSHHHGHGRSSAHHVTSYVM